VKNSDLKKSIISQSDPDFETAIAIMIAIEYLKAGSG
jgi:hypothetical protein